MKVVLGDIAIVVSDAKRSAKWWKQLGFEVRDDAGHWVTVAPPGANVVLHLCAGEGYALEPGNTGIGFFVDDVAQIEKAWTAKGVKFSVPRLVGSASVQARFLDPDGNEFWLFEDEDLKAKPKPKAKPKARKKAAAKRKSAAPGRSRKTGARRTLQGKRRA